MSVDNSFGSARLSRRACPCLGSLGVRAHDRGVRAAQRPCGSAARANRRCDRVL